MNDERNRIGHLVNGGDGLVVVIVVVVVVVVVVVKVFTFNGPAVMVY